MYRKKLPKTAIVSITQRCNSKCSFCNIWSTEKPIDLDINLLDKLPTSLKQINITGGEPLLHKQFSSIIEKFKKNNCRISLNTNGLVDLKKYNFQTIKNKLSIRFSLDATEELHDSLRGIKGNYTRVIDQIKHLQSMNFNDIGISSTFSDINIEYALPLYMLSKHLSVSFTCMVAANSDIYYKSNNNFPKNVEKFKTNIGKIINEETKTFNLKELGKIIYMRELLEFVAGKVKTIQCPAGQEFFFMQPSGEIYACNMRDLRMGNLFEETFENIWFSAKSEVIRKTTYQCTKPCWTMCNAKQIIWNHKFKYLNTLLKVYVKKLTQNQR
ncbi:MAG: hypothetical protein B6D35_14660 [Candidatus Brocadia sp. UTAMX2]|jgi:radical SAM protein with 4Fe4S-binding SPASM domain|nr:MAG: hypothetical protein B6D35_14660 [Candidatus Brocadia sp. UTAMX2]